VILGQRYEKSVKENNKDEIDGMKQEVDSKDRVMHIRTRLVNFQLIK